MILLAQPENKWNELCKGGVDECSTVRSVRVERFHWVWLENTLDSPKEKHMFLTFYPTCNHTDFNGCRCN